MTKVAIIITTRDRPDFVLRQLEFYEQIKSIHPVYISDSSTPENALKITDGVRRFKNLKVFYRWDPPGKDYTCNLLPMVGEKYSMTVNDDDIMIPATVSQCAEFLDEHPDYGTCAGKQVNFHFSKEYFNKPYGIFEGQTRPLGRSYEEEDLLRRINTFWFDQTTICFSVRRTETEKALRNITKHFSLLEDMPEFIVFNGLLTAGKAKSLNKLGYIMQRSIVRYFDHGMLSDFKLISEKWKVCEKEFSEFIQKNSGASEDKSAIMMKAMFVSYLAHFFDGHLAPAGSHDNFKATRALSRFWAKSLFRQIKNTASHIPLIKSIYYKIKPPEYDVTRPESAYFGDFKVVKEFLESRVSA